MEKSFAIHNLGCRVNIYEGEAVSGALRDAGFREVSFDEAADILIINTCTVTAVADKKSRQMIRRAKENNPDAIIAAMGCFVNTAGADELAALPIDIAVGNNEKSRLPELLCDILNEKKDRFTAIPDIRSRDTVFEAMPQPSSLDHTRAFMKVQDGCDRFCSYCIIPFARGKARSRELAGVLEDVKKLRDNGYKEVDISGIYLSGYGEDTGSSLLELLQRINEIDGIERIRMGSLEQGVITEDFVRGIRELPKVCPHFHLSLQSGSDTVLKRMNRHYDSAQYEEKCGILRSCYEHPAITTDVIAGFPGESEEEFTETIRFVEKIGFYKMHVFPYSRREGTVAAKMPGQLTSAEKKRRANELIALSERMSRVFEEYYRGKELEVLFETCENGTVKGHSAEYIEVCAPGEVSMVGTIGKVLYE